MERESESGVQKTMAEETEEATGTISAADVTNLLYEIESAKRQISSLQTMLSSRTREVARLQELLIDREVLLKQAAACIREAADLCREQSEHLDDTKRVYQNYEEAWRTLHIRLDRMQEQMPAVPVSSVPVSDTGNRLDELRSSVGGSVRRAEENLRRIFTEEPEHP